MEKKREILEEQIKQALTSTFRVISNHVEDKNSKNKDLKIKTLDFSEIKDLKSKNDYIRLRANTDSKALKLRFSDNGIFIKNQPKNPALIKIYELSEKIRCEMLGSNMLNGVKRNLENNYYQKINNKKYKDVNAKKDINVLDAFELYIIEKFFKLNLSEISLKTLNYWRKDFDKNFDNHLNYLIENFENQENYNSKFSQLLEKMDIFENNQNQESNQNQDNQNQSNNDTSGDEENNDKQDIQDKVSEDQLSVETDYDVNQFRMEEDSEQSEESGESLERVTQKLNMNKKNIEYKVFTSKFDEIAKAENL